MKKIYSFLFVCFSLLSMYGGQNFVISYTLDGTMTPIVSEGADVVSGSEARSAGKSLIVADFDSEENPTAWVGQIKNNNTNFINTSFRMDISPKPGYGIKIDSVVFIQKMDKTGGAYNFKVGCTLNGTTPQDNVSASPTQYFATSYKEYTFYPEEENAYAQGMNNVSVWISARGLNAAISYWSIDDVKIYGTYASVPEEAALIEVSDNKKQIIRMGVDMAALWYWRSHLKKELAEVAVKELHADYVRVQMNNAYEPYEGRFNEDAYIYTLEVMTAMREANPTIDFFGSPSPLSSTYTKEELVQFFGHADNAPWSPFPLWVQDWVDTERTWTMSDGTVVPVFEKGELRLPQLVSLFANYLNFIHSKGFKIKYLDLSNEQTIISPAITKYVYDNLPAKLNAGVSMPQFVVPSTWGVQGGIDWLKEVDKSKNEHLAFEIAATHNTGGGDGGLEEFGTLAREMGKEAWNSELHEWVGTELHDEIITSETLWEHMRAGFSGIDTWLFCGSWGGRPHSMVYTAWNKNDVVKQAKYEMFKQVVNNANLGNYVEISKPYASTPTAAFIKDGILSVWILNKSDRSLSDALFKFENWDIANKNIEVMRWHKSLPQEGQKSSFTNTSETEFTYDIEGESLYFFKINVGNSQAIDEKAEVNKFNVYPNPISGQVIIEASNALEDGEDGRYSLINMYGQLLETGKLEGQQTILNSSMLTSGCYLVSIDCNGKLQNEKIIIK